MPDATDHLGEARTAMAVGDHETAAVHVFIALVEKLAVIAESLLSIGVGLAMQSAIEQHAALGPCGCETPVVEDGVALCRRCWRNVIPNVKEQDDGA